MDLLLDWLVGWLMYCLRLAGPKAVLPIDGPWRNGSLKAFIRNVDEGKDETGNHDDPTRDIKQMSPP